MLNPSILRRAALLRLVSSALLVVLVVGLYVVLGLYLFCKMPVPGEPRLAKRFIPWISRILVFLATAVTLVTTGHTTWGHGPGLVFGENSNSWGFGQILAVMLLLLTVLQTRPVELKGGKEVEQRGRAGPRVRKRQ